MICALAIGVFMTLFSMQAASACSQPHTLFVEEDITHNHSLAIAASAFEATEQKNLTSYSTSMTSFTLANFNPIFDEEEEEGASCIHGGGCTCTGSKSHKNGCGTAGDCHAHSGLVCTWA
jgi:hypothetical protein